jgi:anaerobic selenocysteine-containing dehydrogenase
MILTTGRQLEHWHTGSMTRRASVLDAVEPEANCSLHPATLRKLGVAPGGMVRLTTKRGRSRSWRAPTARWPRTWCSCPSPMSRRRPTS